MRRLWWLGLGAAVGAAGPRWVTRQARRRRRQQGRPGPLPLPDAVGATALVAGRALSRATGAGARRVRGRVRRAVDGGRHDARRSEERLRRALAERPARTGDRGEVRRALAERPARTGGGVVRGAAGGAARPTGPPPRPSIGGGPGHRAR